MRRARLIGVGCCGVLLATALAWGQTARSTSGHAHTEREEMVSIPSGTFRMGAGNPAGDDGEHPVTVAAFAMGRTEVTVEAYGRCVTAGTCTAPEPMPNQPCNWGVAGREHHPINCVDWSAATTYCHWADARLPTEAEWEYAARGADGRPCPWGESPPTNQLCWGGVESRPGTCPVASFPAGNSLFGLSDMAGNVWEWTADWYSSYRASGPTALQNNRVLRGGSWAETSAGGVRSSLRFALAPAVRSVIIGFRCARGPS